MQNKILSCVLNHHNVKYDSVATSLLGIPMQGDYEVTTIWMMASAKNIPWDFSEFETLTCKVSSSCNNQASKDSILIIDS